MRFISTRGKLTDTYSFEEAVLFGYAADGGILVRHGNLPPSRSQLPENIPRLFACKDDLEGWRGLSFAEIAFRIIRAFVLESESACSRVCAACFHCVQSRTKI